MIEDPTRRDVAVTGAAAAALSATALAGIPEAQGQTPPPYGFAPLRKSNQNEMSAKLVAYRPKAKTFGDAVVEYAQAGLGKGEIGGDNAGHLTDWLTQTPPNVTPAWCAAFVCYAWFGASYGLQQVAPWQTWHYGKDGGIDPELWVPNLALNAQKANKFVSGMATTAQRTRIIPGSVLFVRGGEPAWVHTGIVERVENDSVYGIEGNTGAKSNPSGLDMVTRLRRPLGSCDYGVV